MARKYVYGMRSKGFAEGNQPAEGLLEAETDPLDEYWNVLVYSRRLTDQECREYDLDRIGTRYEE